MWHYGMHHIETNIYLIVEIRLGLIQFLKQMI